MTDLEMTKLCAEAMGYEWRERTSGKFKSPPNERTKFLQIYWASHDDWYRYDPFHDNAQAMALVDWLIERGELFLSNGYGKFTYHGAIFHSREWKQLVRRFLVECVAKMQAGK